MELRLEAGEVEVKVEYARSESTSCPECGVEAARYDSRVRRWHHLPTCQYKTILAAEVPRVRCPQHGVKTLAVPWAEPESGFRALFEALVIDWLREASIQAVARRLDLTWDEVDGVMQREVRRGLARRRFEVPQRLGVDETSFQKRHGYATVVADVGRGVVQHVADGRDNEALAAYYDRFTEEELKHVARMIKRHLDGVLNAIVAAVTNARLEGINTMIQGLKRSAEASATATASAMLSTSSSAASTSTRPPPPTRIPEEPSTDEAAVLPRGERQWRTSEYRSPTIANSRATSVP